MDPTTFNESVINLIAIIEVSLSRRHLVYSSRSLQLFQALMSMILLQAPAKLVEPDRRDEVVTGLRASLKLLHDGAAVSARGINSATNS